MMSVDVARPIPVVTAEVPVLSGDVLRETKTPAINPPAARDESPDNATVANALATRRLSAGAVIAEQIGIDLDAIGLVEARKIMSVEHKVLGFRPPHGSLAAEAQAAAAKHPEVKGVSPPDPEKLKEAAKVDAERILAERVKSEKEGSGAGAGKSVVIPGTGSGSETVVDLNSITEEEARRLMSHEHRALGFRPPPGSLAAEAQAAAAKQTEPSKPRRNSNEPARKPRQQSMTVATAPGTNAHVRRGSSETRGKPRQNSSSANGNGTTGARRGSNESGKPRRGSGERNGGARRSSAVAPANKDELLREAALRDAERIKATRGVNGTQVSEQTHIDIKDLAADVQVGETINLPAPAQANVDREAKTEVSQREVAAERDTATGMQGQDVSAADALRDMQGVESGKPDRDEMDVVTETEVAPGELEHEVPATPVMSRTETTDSVEIVCDVLA